MLKYEDFPKKCLKCKRSDLHLEKFQVGYRKMLTYSISSTRRSFREETTSSGYSIRIPVCKRCKKQFKAHMILSVLFRLFILINFLTLILTIIFTLVPPSLKFPLNILPFIITFIPTIILGAVIGIYPHKIRNYIELTESGPIIKDPDYKKEVDDYRTLRAVEDKLDINKIPCSNCGSLVRQDADFCLSCGKDLR